MTNWNVSVHENVNAGLCLVCSYYYVCFVCSLFRNCCSTGILGGKSKLLISQVK